MGRSVAIGEGSTLSWRRRKASWDRTRSVRVVDRIVNVDGHGRGNRRIDPTRLTCRFPTTPRINKPVVIRTLFHPPRFTSGFPKLWFMAAFVLTGVTGFGPSSPRFATPGMAQEAAQNGDGTNASDDENAGDAKPSGDQPTDVGASPQYPIMVAVADKTVYTVDLELPGVWKSNGDQTERFFTGSPLLRKPLNRPRAIAIHPQQGLLVGDSATREIYHLPAADGDAKPLNDGFLGNVMCLCVSRDGKTIYVGDTERRATFRLPIEGGQPKLVARVNARALSWLDDNTLVASTPDDPALVTINVDDGSVEPLVPGRPFQYVGFSVVGGRDVYVSDVYSKCIWKTTIGEDGQASAPEQWFSDESLRQPVGMTIDDQSVYVADPKSKRVYAISRETAKITTKYLPES